jgi:hypothetical protein
MEQISGMFVMSRSSYCLFLVASPELHQKEQPATRDGHGCKVEITI